MTEIIKIRNVSKTFLSQKVCVEAIGNVLFDVNEHQFVSVLGPSGCGKSTLLRIIAGLIPPTSGEVIVHGNRVNGPNPEVGIVFQSPVLLPWRNVLDNIELQVEVRGLDRAIYRDKAKALLGLVGLEGFETSYPWQLSGGMQQRVSLCRALIHDPSLLLMDEPFGALDAFTREQMNLELQRIWLETKKTVLFITHNIAEAVFLSDQIIILCRRPSKVQEVIKVDLSRPRTLDSMHKPEFLQAVDRCRDVLISCG